ncbi:hypothetical protein G3I70_32670 [Actinomadura bangladeshensis]|uniref:SAM-dependent methyltransferase n=1 Tax=Actinomadura bangladeshensis TaxID=453573 RepID=A0A6L9QP20_9ACTN|nr:hypothetical protein [Actinomadura bangladeshensis]
MGVPSAHGGTAARPRTVQYRAHVDHDDSPSIADIPHDVPTSARAYGWLLGGKENYEVDRQFIRAQLEHHPAGLDITRQNRLFLYRAVRYLAVEAGIRQFIDMGCGLPTDANVHQVAQQFVPDARVVYVDIDPIVLAHGRALLAGDASTTVIQGDMRDQEAILADADLRRLIDFSEPVATLFLSVGHHLPDADDPHRVLHTIMDRAAPGSHLTFSQVACDDPVRSAEMTEQVTSAGIPWQTRTPAQIDALLSGFDPVEPGLCNLVDWRPLDLQPPLAPVPEELKRYEGASKLDRGIYEYGGVLRKR